jgi:hypothetical protein
VGFRFRRRPVTLITLATELQKLERQAVHRRVAGRPPYSRSLLAERSGVPAKTLGGWLDGERKPQDPDKLMRVIDALADLAGQDRSPEQDWERTWKDRWAAARKPDARPAHRRVSLRTAVISALGAAGAAVIAGFFTPLGQSLENLVVPPSSASAGQTSPLAASQQANSPGSQAAAGPAESLQASAVWCCRFATVDASGGYWWPGTAASLDTALGTARTKSASDLVPAGAGVLEIPLQTAGTEPIYVAPPQVIVHSRRPNITTGLVAILPLSSQGADSAREFVADLDTPSPTTRASGGQAGQYYYVSSGSPEILILTLKDTDCDCTFDVRLNWQAQGHLHVTLLTNAGRHYRMVGSSGLPWYSGDPGFGVKLAHVGGRPFSAYAP